MSNWIKIKPFEGHIHQGCLNCPPITELADLEMLIAVGFGSASVSKDNEVIYDENRDNPGMVNDPPKLMRFEELARLDPDHDWQVDIFGPLRGRKYQRHEEGKWILIDSNMGFA